MPNNNNSVEHCCSKAVFGHHNSVNKGYRIFCDEQGYHNLEEQFLPQRHHARAIFHNVTPWDAQ